MITIADLTEIINNPTNTPDKYPKVRNVDFEVKTDIVLLSLEFSRL